MAGLALKLAPQEQVMINGVVVENGPRRAQLLIRSENAAVLRLRDALKEGDLIGPASEAYFAAQRCVAGEIDADEATRLLEPLLPILADRDPDIVDTARGALDAGNLYRTMRSLRPLVERERAERAEVA